MASTTFLIATAMRACSTAQDAIPSQGPLNMVSARCVVATAHENPMWIVAMTDKIQTSKVEKPQEPPLILRFGGSQYLALSTPTQ